MRFYVPALFMLHAFVLTAQRQLVEMIVARVGDEMILLSDVEEYFYQQKSRYANIPDDVRCHVLEEILTEKLLVNQAKLDSVIVDDDQVEQQLAAKIDHILGLMGNDVRYFEEYYGKSVAQVRADFRDDLRSQLTAQRMRSKVMENAKITPAEVKSYFESIPKDSLPYFNAEVEVGEILFKPTVNAVERQKAIDRVNRIRERLMEGEDFAELATRLSDDPMSARSGGDLGMQKRGTFVPEFEAAAYNLSEGEISDVTESQFGFHIIQLIKRRGNVIHTRHILVKPEITQADLDLAEAKLDSIRTAFLTDTITFEVLVRRHSDKDAQSFSNGGRMINALTGNTFFETSQLDVDIFFAIDTLDIGELSRPLKFRDQTGEIAFRIVQLQTRTEPHVANLRQDYTKIKQAAINEREHDFLQKWIEEKIVGTYVFIDQAFINRYGCGHLEKWTNSQEIARQKRGDRTSL